MKYNAGETLRQKFGAKERDGETGLDYFLARYYAGTQGRFTSVDPENAGADEEDTQSWNGYAYARNNPLLFVDPDGREYYICGPNGCGTISDEEFYRERYRFRAPGNRLKFTGDSSGYYGSGNIYSEQGEHLASYRQISIDDRAHELAAGVQQRFKDPETYKRAAVGAVIGALLKNQPRFVPRSQRVSQIDRFSRAAAAPDRGGLTAAGRSLTKHGAGARPGNTRFPAAKGNPSQINQQAQDIVDDILTNPGTTVTHGHRPHGIGATIEFTAPDGRGLVFKSNGKFVFFKE